MLRFYYDPKYKYTNRTIIDVTDDTNYVDKEYENIDTNDEINGHIIYVLSAGEKMPTYIIDSDTGRRWYVSGITQLRTNKYQISLLRDIISESPDVWKTERAYVEAGTAPAGDYCKYKKWGLPFTNTKIGQQRLDFGGRSSFFVFYANQQNTSDDNVITEDDLKLKYTALPNVYSDFVALDSLSEIPGYEIVGAGSVSVWQNKKAQLKSGLAVTSISGDYYIGSNYLDIDTETSYVGDINAKTYSSGDSIASVDNGLISVLYPDFFNNSNTSDGRIEICNHIKQLIFDNEDDFATSSNKISYPQTTIKSLESYVGQILRVPTSVETVFHYYRINKTVNNTVAHNDLIPYSYVKTLPSYLISAYEAGYIGSGYSYGALKSSNTYYPRETDTGLFLSTENVVAYELEDLGEATSFDFTFSASTYKLPRSAVRCVNIVPDDSVSALTLEQCLMIAQTNAEVQGDNIGQILDIQYLPFSVATEQNDNFKVGDHSCIASFLTQDDYTYSVDLDDLININKETDSVVIVSPSRKSQYQYSPYNNNGNMEFSVQVTLKPYQSTIYVRPSTKGLLVLDWNDKEGLIMEENCSLTTVNSAWANYVYSNQNYQNTFNLQMSSKEYERSWERRVEEAQAKSDDWTARNISAQKASTYTGNIPIISSIASAIGTAWQDQTYMQMAQLDREYNEALYQNSVQVATQNFQYQLDNVKSQPLMPNNITALDVKVLDGIYLELYSTNSTEKASIANYYVYNGNRIENYGSFETYWGPFVRGRILYSLNYTQPEFNELNKRLQTGIFTEELS